MNSEHSSSGLRLAWSQPEGPSFEPPPYVDERLVRPETREEMIRGRLFHRLPAEVDHADLHSSINCLLRGLQAPGYVGSCMLLTRAGPRTDIASDTCIRRAGTDPRTGSRFLEELVVEVVDVPSLDDATERAELLADCGVRRLLAVFCDHDEVREWSAPERRWVPLDLSGTLRDPTLVVPLPLRAIFDRVEADNAVARALEAKDVPAIAEMKAEAYERGLARGRLLGRLETTCERLGIAVEPNELSRWEGLERRELEGLLAHLERKGALP